MTWHAQALRVAVLDDDDVLREDILVPQLGECGFHAEGFFSSEDLHRHLRTAAFDLLVLDVGLPDAYGLDIAHELRATSPIGIVTLTGRNAQAERIRGLTDAVDAWLMKPVEIELLAATLYSVARRMHATNSSPAQAPSGAWRLAQRGWHLYSPDNHYIALNLLERYLLGRLLATPGEVVTRVEIVTLLGSATENFDSHRLEMLIHRLRRKVRDHFGESLPLRSVRGQGYVMIAAG